MATRVKVRHLTPGMKTEFWEVTGPAVVVPAPEPGDTAVHVPVRWSDGGDDIRVWDHPDIEVEVEETDG